MEMQRQICIFESPFESIVYFSIIFINCIAKQVNTSHRNDDANAEKILIHIKLYTGARYVLCLKSA